MSLSDLASLGSFVSGLAVLASLVFLYFQLRQMNAQAAQAEKTQQAMARHTRAARIVDISLASTEPSWADAVYKGMAGHDDLTLTQLRQFDSYVVARMSNAEDAFYQYQEGAFDQGAFDRFVRRMRQMFSSIGIRVAYRKQRAHFGSEFIEFMDKLASDTSVAAPLDDLARWRIDVAAERSLAAP